MKISRRTTSLQSRQSRELSGARRNGKRRSGTERGGIQMTAMAQIPIIHRLEEYGYHVQSPIFADSEGTQYYQVEICGTHIATLGVHPAMPGTLYINQIYTENDIRPGRPHASDIYMSFWYQHIPQLVGAPSPLRNFVFENIEEGRLESVVKAIHRDARSRQAIPIWDPPQEHRNFNAICQTRLPKSVAWLLHDYHYGVEMRGMQIQRCEIQLLGKLRSGDPPEFNLHVEVG